MVISLEHEDGCTEDWGLHRAVSANMVLTIECKVPWIACTTGIFEHGALKWECRETVRCESTSVKWALRHACFLYSGVKVHITVQHSFLMTMFSNTALCARAAFPHTSRYILNAISSEIYIKYIYILGWCRAHWPQIPIFNTPQTDL